MLRALGLRFWLCVVSLHESIGHYITNQWFRIEGQCHHPESILIMFQLSGVLSVVTVFDVAFVFYFFIRGPRFRKLPHGS